MATVAEIEECLSPLVALPLWGITRAATLESFQFGPRRLVTQQAGPRAGMQKEVGAYALHVQCAWAIMGPAGWVVGSRDLHEIVDGGADWDRAGANRCDLGVQAFLVDACPLSVVSARARSSGEFRLELERGYALEVSPGHAADGEQWRFFAPYKPDPHVIFAERELRKE